jgi:hypothetical protein
MGLFDYFSKERGEQRRRESALKRVTEMYYKPEERAAALYDMQRLATENSDNEAIRIMLRRFDFISPNHTVDLSEKELAHDLVCQLGEIAVEPTRIFCRKTTHPIYWQLKILDNLLSSEDMIAFIVELLSDIDNDYHRDPQRKISVIQWAADLHTEPTICGALIPFVEDHHEDVRYLAVDGIVRGGFAEARDTLLARLTGEEESRRVFARIAQGFADAGWPVTERLEEVKAQLPVEFQLQPDGTLRARR